MSNELALALVSALAAIALCAMWVRERNARLEQAWQLRKLTCRISTLDRWCCHDFPIVSAMCGYLLGGRLEDAGPDDRAIETIDAFRTYLRCRYGLLSEAMRRLSAGEPVKGA